MIKRIHPKNLYRYFWHPKPLIYFYNGNGMEGNNSIVTNMVKYSNKYSYINVYEILWIDQLNYNYYTNPKIVNFIYFYAEGKFKEKIENPNEDEIKELFEKSIKYFNIAIENKARNVGSRSQITAISENIESKNQDQSFRKMYNLQESKRKYIRKRKILLSDNETTKNTKTDNSDFMMKSFDTLHKKQYYKPNSCIENKSFNDKIKNNLPSQPWYSNVQINDLPPNIIQKSFDKHKIIDKNFLIKKSIEFNSTISAVEQANNNSTISNKELYKASNAMSDFKNINLKNNLTKRY